MRRGKEVGGGSQGGWQEVLGGGSWDPEVRTAWGNRGVEVQLATEWSDQEETWPHPLNPALRIWGVSFQIEFTPEQIEGEWLRGVRLEPQGCGAGSRVPQAESPAGSVGSGWSRVGCLWKCPQLTPPPGRVQGSLHAVRSHAQVRDEDHVRAVWGRAAGAGPESDAGRGAPRPGEAKAGRWVRSA